MERVNALWFDLDELSTTLFFVQCYCKQIIYITMLQKMLGAGRAEPGLRQPHFFFFPSKTNTS